MGSQCCKCTKGKDEQQSRPTSINIRFHGSQEISTFRYKLRPYENIDRYRSKPSRNYYTGYHPRITEILDNHNSPTDNVRPVRRRIKSMNSNGISGIPRKGDPPIFIRKLTDLAVKVGTRIRFLVEIQSSSCPQVTWHRNHEPVQNGSRFSFVHEGNFYCIDVAPVTVNDEGYWTCTAENINGRSSSSCCLNIIIPKAYKKPHFLEELRAILTEGGNVSLECKVLGVPTPVLKWFKDDKEMKAGDIFALTALSDDPTSLGIYRCEAINCMGIASSSSKVHVIGSEDGDKSIISIQSSGPLPVFKKLLKNEACKIGENLTLSCQIQVPPWPKDVAWYNESGRIESNEKYHIMEDGLGIYSIEIHGLEAVDKGEWKCVATSMENVKQFTTSRVSMVIPKNYRIPRFMEDLRAILTEEGLVSFECKVVGFPTPVLKWFKDGEELKPGDVYQLTGTNSLGSYCCIAKNCMGEARSTAELTIEDIEKQLNEEERLQLKKEFTQVPKFKIGLKCCEATINEHFTFAVRLDVTISPEPSVSWYRNDELIIEDAKYKLVTEKLGNFHLEIKNLELIDQAQWKCLAENDFGHSVTSCFLKLIIPRHFKKPKYLENLRAVLSKDGTVSLECKVIGVPQPVLKWYKDGIELKPGDIHRIISGDNGTCCLGTYTCEATNCMGSVSSSAALLGFEDDPKQVQNQETQQLPSSPKNISLSTIHEERTSQLYDTPQTEYSVTLDDHGEVSFSFDGKEVSVSLYETPDLTEEDAIQIVEMYADQLSEHITEGDIIELPPMRFTKETSTSGNLLMEAVVIDVSSDYFIPNEHFEDLRTEMDVEDVSIMDDQTQSNISSYSSAMGQTPSRPLRKRQRSEESGSSKSDHSEKSHRKSIRTLSEDYHSAQEPSSISHDAVSFADFSEINSPKSNERNINSDRHLNQDKLPQSQYFTEGDTDDNRNNVPDNKAFESPSEVINQQLNVINDSRRITRAISDLEQTVQNFLLMQEKSDDSGMFIIAEKLEIIHQSLQPFISTIPSDESYGIMENYIDELVLGMLTEPLEDLAQITRRFYTSQTTDDLLNDFEKVIMDFKLKLETLAVALETYENESSRTGITETHRQLSRHLHCIMNDISKILLKESSDNMMKSEIHGAIPDNYESEREIFNNNQVESMGTIKDLPLIFSSIHFALSSALEKASANTFDEVSEMKVQNEKLAVYSSTSTLINDIENLRQCIGDITMTLATPVPSMTSGNDYDFALNEFEKLKIPLSHLQEDLLTREYQPEETCILKNIMTPIQNLKKAVVNVAQKNHSELEIIRLLETIERHASLAAISSSNETLIEEFEETDRILQPLKLDEREGERNNATMDVHRVPNVTRAEQLDLWTLTTLEPLDRLANAALSLDRSISEEVHTLLCKPLDSLYKQIDLMKCQINRPAGQSLENDVETIIEGFLWPVDQLRNAISMSIEIWREKPAGAAVRQHLEDLADSVSDLCEQLTILQEKVVVEVSDNSYEDRKTDASLIETIAVVVGPLQDIREAITMMLNTIAFENVDEGCSVPLPSGEMSLNFPMDTGGRIEHNDVETLNKGFVEEPMQTMVNVDNVQRSLQSEQLSNDGLSCPLDTRSMQDESLGDSVQGNLRCINEEGTREIADDELMKTAGGKLQRENLPADFLRKILGESETKNLKGESESNKQIKETGTLHELLEDYPVSNNEISSDAIQPTGKEVPEYFQVPLENIPNIIEDELNRQGALEYASNDFIELVQEKVNMTISRNSNIDQQSIFEEMVRDITVEELQSIKSHEHTIINNKIDNQFISLPEAKSNDSIQPFLYQEELETVNIDEQTCEKIIEDVHYASMNEEPHDTSMMTMGGDEQSREFLQESVQKVLEMSELVQSSGNNGDFEEPNNKTFIVHNPLKDFLIPNEPMLDDSSKVVPGQGLIPSDVADNTKVVENKVDRDSQVSLESISYIIEDELDRQGAIEYASTDFIKLIEGKVHAITSKSSHISQQSILEEMIRDVTVEELQSIKSHEHTIINNKIDNQFIGLPEAKSNDSIQPFLYQKELETVKIDEQTCEKIIEDVHYASMNEEPHDTSMKTMGGDEQSREFLQESVQKVLEMSELVQSLGNNGDFEEPNNKTFIVHNPLKDFLITNEPMLDDSSKVVPEQGFIPSDVVDNTKVVENKVDRDSQVSLESISHIIKDELDRQGAIECASTDFIKLIEGKVHAIISKSSHISQQSILEEMIRDVTVEELQCIKSKEKAASEDDIRNDQILLHEQRADDGSLQHSQYQEFCEADPLENIRSDEHTSEKIVEDLHYDSSHISIDMTNEIFQNSALESMPSVNEEEPPGMAQGGAVLPDVEPKILEQSGTIQHLEKDNNSQELINKLLTAHEALKDSPIPSDTIIHDSSNNTLGQSLTSSDDIQTTELENLEHAQNNLTQKTEGLENSQVLLESIPNIIKDELHRQDALECASIDFINQVQEKVYATISKSSHIDHQSILEELVRDITVEELQSIKSDKLAVAVMNDHIDKQSILSPQQKSDGGSIQPSQDKEFCEENQSEKIKTDEQECGRIGEDSYCTRNNTSMAEDISPSVPENMRWIDEEVHHETLETSEPIPSIDKSADLEDSSNKALVHETLDDSPALIEPMMNDSSHNALDQALISPDVIQASVFDDLEHAHSDSVRDDEVPEIVQISLESIPHIIEDELDRQGALELATISFINLVQEKVYATLSKSSNIDQQSIFEEMIRDLTVEELQSIKSVEKGGRFHSEIRPVEIPMEDSNRNEIKEFFTLESEYTTGKLIQSEGHEEIIKSKDREKIFNFPSTSDGRDSAEAIEELSPVELETQNINVVGIINSDHDELKNINAAKTIIDTSLDEATEPLVISHLEKVSASTIEQEKYIEPVQPTIESTVLHSPISSIQSTPEEGIDNLSIAEVQEQNSKVLEDDIPITLKEQTQLIDTTQSCDHEELKNISSSQTVVDISLDEAIEPLAISEHESASAITIEGEKYVDPVKSITRSTILQSPISSMQCSPEESTQDLEIAELQKETPQVVEDDSSMASKEDFKRRVSDAKENIMILRRPSTMEIGTPWETPNDAVNSETLDQRVVASDSDRIISIGSPLLSHCQMSDQPLEGLNPLEPETQIMDIAQSCHHDELKNISPTKSVIDISVEEVIKPLVTSKLESVSAKTIQEEKHIDPVKPNVHSTILQSPMSLTQWTTEECTQDLVIAELQEEKPKVLDSDSAITLQGKSTMSVSDLKTNVMILRRPSSVELETQWEIPKDAVNSEASDRAIIATSVDDILQPAAQHKHVIFNYPQVLDEVVSNEDVEDIVGNSPVSHNVEAVNIDPLVKASEHEVNVQTLQSKVVNDDGQNFDDGDSGGRIINPEDSISIELGKTELIPESVKGDVRKPSGEVLKSSEDESFEEGDKIHLESDLLTVQHPSKLMEIASESTIISDPMQTDDNDGKEHCTDDRKPREIKKVNARQIKESPEISEEWIREVILTEVNHDESESVLSKTHIDDLVRDIHRQAREKLKELHSEEAMEYAKKIVAERLHELMTIETPRKSKKSDQESDSMDIMEFHGSEMRKVQKPSAEVSENLTKHDGKRMKNGAEEHSEETMKDVRKSGDILHPQPEDGSYPKESEERKRARKHGDASVKSLEGQSGINRTGDSQRSKVIEEKLKLDVSEQKVVGSASTAGDKYSEEKVVESVDNSMKNENQLNVEDIKLIAEIENKVKKEDTTLADPAEEFYGKKSTRKDGSDLISKKNSEESNVTDDQVPDKVETPSSDSDGNWRKRHEKQVNEHKPFEDKSEAKKVGSDHQKLPTDQEISGKGGPLKKTGYINEEESEQPRLEQNNRPRSLKKNDKKTTYLMNTDINPSGPRDKSKGTRYASDIESSAEDSNLELAFVENNLSMGSESSDSLRLNTRAGQLRERDTVGHIPSISIDFDELMTHDYSRYSDHSTRTFKKYQRSDVSSVSTHREYSPGPKQKGKKPVFCMKLIDRTATASSRIKLTCTVLGDPDPSVIWMHNGRELLQSSNRYCMINDNGVVSLEIYSVKPRDSGEYACLARNIHGEASTEAKLKVYAEYESTPSLPIFTRSIKDTFKLDEGKLILECRVRAQPSPIVTWLKDGKIIEMNDRYRQSDLAEGICRLQISNPCDKDNGMYTCRAENQSGFGECTSRFINYKNIVAPKSEVTAMKTYKKGHILTSEMHSTVDHDIHSFILPDPWESDRSIYTYRPDQNLGHIESHPNFDGEYFYTREYGKPAAFISRPVDKLIHACGGEDVSLSFRVGGVPKPKVILMKGLIDITNGSRAYKESHDDYVRLTFKRIELSDEGTYCILVKNRYGYERCFFTIRVKQRARSLTPARSTEWNFENVKDYLSHIHESTQSQYKFVPGPISSEPIVIDGGKSWLALSWGKADQRGPAPVVAYRVDAWLIGGDGGARWVELGVTSTNSFDAFNLCPGEDYKFRITPRNRYGWGESVTMTNPVTVKEIVKFPEFSKILPGQLKALKGTSLNLNCEISSKSVTYIRWYKDSTELDMTHDPRFVINNTDSKCSLSIIDIRETDSGRYVCDATNVAGRVSTFARVQVVTDPKIADADLKLRRMRTIDSSSEERPPEFTMRLRDRRVQVTYPVRLTCQVDGYPEPEVTWYKDEEKINPEVENMTISKDEAHFHTLEISRSKIDNTGIYMVRAQNAYGSLSCRCHLVVDEGIRAYITPEFSRLLDPVYTVVQNEELRMTAQVEAYPAVGIIWYRDGKRLRPDRNTVMSLNHDGTIELALAHISYKNAGLYCCIAANEVGRAESKTKVQVSMNNEDMESFIDSSIEVGQSSNVPYSKEPVFITKPLSTEAFEGDNIIIVCEVIGDPKPDVIWLRDFLRPDYYKDAPHFRPVGLGPQYRLEIPYAKLDFTGTYSVIAKNCFGAAKAVISLQIYAKDPETQEIGRKQTVKHSEVQTLPIIKSPLKNIRCCDGDAVTFICNFDATPPPDIRWEKGGKLVPLQGDVSVDFEGGIARLHIEHVYPEDEGEYICIAYNDLGSAYTSACLIVDVPEGKEISLNRRLKKPISLLSPNATPISTPRSTPIRSLSPSCVRREFKQKSGQRPRMPAAPKFYAVPHNRVAEEGDTIRFQCAVAGHPTPWSNWDKDGITVTSTARVTIKEKEDLRILEITQVTYEDAGLYRITLENDIGRVEATARLEIIRGKHESISRGIMETSRQIRAASDRPQNHTSLSSDNHFSSSSLLDRYTGRDTNNPTCLSHHHREKFPNEDTYEEPYDSVEFEMEQPPVILSSPADVIAVKGENVVLLATYSGYPEPTVQWFQEGQNITPHDETYISSTIGLTCLTLSKITYGKSGKYIIYIENAVGSDSKYVNVRVEAPESYSSVSESSLVAGGRFEISHFESQITNIPNKMNNSEMKNQDRDDEDFEYGEIMPINIFEDRYDILEEVGKGRYGVVRKIIDKSTDTYLAAKFVRTIKAKDREQVLKEISIMNTMDHPKLLRLITAFGGSKEMIMVTEYISGGELFERVVADDFTLTERDSVLFVRQICEGVAYMHDKYIVHMDLKPENIMCQTRTCHRIKLIDFGLAQTLTPDTPVRVLFGTPEFISPEIIDFEPIGTESDMWSIGVICYVLLTGLSPFMGDSDAETFVNITRADYDFDDVAFDAISKEAIDFISSLLIKKKELRLSATDCLTHPWLTQSAEKMSQVILSTDKLKNFIVRRKWQKTGNAIRALGRMANLSAKSRKNVLTEAVSEEIEHVHLSQDNHELVEHSGIDELSQSSMEPLTADLSELTSHYSEIKCSTEVISDETQLENDFDMKTCDEMNCVSESEQGDESELEKIEEISDEIADKDENIHPMENISELRRDSQEKLNSVLDDEKYNPSFFNHFSNIQIYQPIVKNLGDTIPKDEGRFEKCETRDIDNLIHRGTPEIMKNERKVPVLSKNVFIIRNNDFLNKDSTQSQCETNKLQLDEEDEKGEIPRITSTLSPLRHVRTGNVSRTAKLFEKEDVSSSIRQPSSRLNLSAARPKNERIRKAFEFWNK